MSNFNPIFEQAAGLRQTIAGDALSSAGPAELISAAIDHFELFLSPEHANSANLRGSMAVLEDDVIFYDASLTGWFREYCIAHEIGHFVLHQTSVHCDAEQIVSPLGDDEASTAESKVAGYGPQEIREREANQFALEFLLPADKLRELFIAERKSVSEIVAATGFPAKIIYGQLARAILLPPAPTTAVVSAPVTSEPTRLTLDNSQRRAAEATSGPLLIAAGPGTGKTQTLVHRIMFLLEQGVAPTRILALTFSNKAATEMRERIAAQRPDDARQMQIMTFHGFGFEILRRYWREAGLAEDSPIIDKLDAIVYLESRLIDLNLVYFQQLHDPAQDFPAILQAISRAKDELCDPAKYRQLGLAMRNAAGGEDEDAVLKAEKVLEVARVYDVYQSWLDDTKRLDYGDLIFRAVRLLQQNHAIRLTLRDSYDHVLVDEFQDVNRACGVLLREVAGDGKGLWAVGDLRQSIYRWRGASPENIRRFHEDFPSGKTLSLEQNYRSGKEIVGLFSAFARAMKASGDGVFADWQTFQSEAAEISFTVGATLDDEIAAIATAAKEAVAGGIEFSQQAVICRTHAQLTKVAERLTFYGVPVLYLGDVFEREEVRDLLALIELRHSKNGVPLWRVGRFPEYSIPEKDIRTVLDAAGKDDVSFRDVLNDEELLRMLSEEARRGITRLRGQLAAVAEDASPWEFISNFLFESGSYLADKLTGVDVSAAQRRLAVYQFLSFAATRRDEPADDGKNVAGFLQHIRRLAKLREDRELARIPDAAAGLDAVRLLTVHAAKGLEFDHVYIPFLSTTQFPGNRRGDRCPTPVGLIESAPPDADQHAEEEECLFFVALSRARRKLRLSRHEGRNKASKFIEALTDYLPSPIVSSGAKPFLEAVRRVEFSRTRFHESQLKRYKKCPRQFYYRDVCGLGESREQSIYQRFHEAVYETVREIRATTDANGRSAASIRAHFEEIWQTAKIDEHAYAPFYRAVANQMVDEICRRYADVPISFRQDQMSVKFDSGEVFFAPGVVEEIGEEVRISQIRARKSPSTKTVELDDYLRFTAAAEAFADRATVTLVNHYLKDGVTTPVDITARVAKNRREEVENLIAAINDGEFPAKPDEQNCPNCPYYFICPA